LLKEFEVSGLTQKEFAKLHGVKTNTLSKWKMLLKGKKKYPKKRQPVKFKEEKHEQEPVNFLSLELSEGIKLEEKVLVDKSGLFMLLELTKC
jgi:transposase-like protein